MMFCLEVKRKFHRYQGDMDWCWVQMCYSTSFGEIEAAIERLSPNQEYRVIIVLVEGIVL